MEKSSCWRSLDNHQIAFLIMNRLWRMYDAGGVSIRRSLRAALLEVILGLIKIENYFNEDAGLGIETLVEEARTRKVTNCPVQLYFNFGLKGMPHSLFFCFILREMRRWYKEQENEYLSNHERKIVETLCYLFDCDRSLAQFDVAGVSYSREQLLQEGDDRSYTRFLYGRGLYEWLVVCDGWVD